MQLLNDSFLAALHLWEYQLYAGSFDAVALALLYFSVYLCTAQQRLARNAAAVQAGSAQFVHFDDDDRLAKLGRADRRHITSGSSAQNSHVTGNCHYMYPPVITP
ncbi:hypothetical protein D3C81_1813500 [compost metagenome]